MNNLYEKILGIYPSLAENDLEFHRTVILQDDSDGKGAYIAEWNHPTLPKPTDEQLKGV